MSTAQNEQLAQLRAEVLAIEAAMQEAVRNALLAHKRAGLPVVTWQDGRIVWIPAKDIPVTDSPAS
ncbi:MAG TPA: hypothetical protein VNH11_23935 [Pirellulales bacterium]|nr:hypothetical protein [Pirellulales bacterium]